MDSVKYGYPVIRLSGYEITTNIWFKALCDRIIRVTDRYSVKSYYLPKFSFGNVLKQLEYCISLKWIISCK